MENSRIKRLILAEYRELREENILVESPFAETTRDGQGLREVALALTRTELIVATDVLSSSHRCWCPKDVDPCIETLELVSIYSLHSVTLSIFRKRSRNTIKARFIDGRKKYYEMGGLNHRSKYWGLWCSHVRSMLETKRVASSMSETSAAASSTYASTVYELRSISFDCDNNDNTLGCCCENDKRWTHDGSGDTRTWTKKNLYLGSSYEELINGHYTPIPVQFTNSFRGIKDEQKNCPANKKLSNSCYKAQALPDNNLCNVILKRKDCKRCVDRQLLAAQLNEYTNRERGGHNSRKNLKSRSPESSLCLTRKDEPECDSLKLTFNKDSSSRAQNLSLNSKIGMLHMFSKLGFEVSDKSISSVSSKNKSCTCLPVNPREIVESGVSIWENASSDRSLKKRNLRRYRISSMTYFLHAFGPWSVHPGDRESLQNRRSHSCVSIRRQPVDPELQLPVSRRQLAAKISLTDLSGANTMASTRGEVVLFWTPDYWYRPRAAVDAYQDIRRHLDQLREFQTEKERYTNKRELFGRRGRRRPSRNRRICDVCSRSGNSPTECIFNRIFANNATIFRGIQLQSKQYKPKGTTTYLRKLLKLEYQVTLWDLDSTTLAKQLTLVDRKLFTQVPRTELEILVRSRSTRDAPNFRAWIAFAHRVSCLTASEILSMGKVETRAHLVARLLNAAKKCFDMGNFHSTRSIVAGLQSPAIYRLKETWMYLKIHHATNYEIMEKLCKVFKSTITKQYRKKWLEAERNPSLIPYVGDVLSRLLDCANDNKFSSRNLRVQNKNVLRKTILKEKSTKPNQQKRIVGKWNYSEAMREIRTSKCRSQGQEEPRRYFTYIWTSHHQGFLEGDCNEWREASDAKHGIDNLANWLERCQRQAQLYDFRGQTLAREFLLKARYTEDRDNFFLSLQLESPPTLDEAKSR